MPSAVTPDYKIYQIYKGYTGNISLKEICEIKPKNSAKFDTSIISIIQSKIDGQILILDKSGNLYLFTSPDIKSYIQSKYDFYFIWNEVRDVRNILLYNLIRI